MADQLYGDEQGKIVEREKLMIVYTQIRKNAYKKLIGAIPKGL